MRIKKEVSFLFGLTTLALAILLSGCVSEVEPEPPEEIITEVVHVPETDEFGIVVDSLETLKDSIRRNDTLARILSRHNVSSRRIHEIALASEDVFDLRRLVSGRDYKVYLTADSLSDARYFVYQADPVEYVVFDLSEPIRVYTGQREVSVEQRAVSGSIESSLYLTLSRNDATPRLATLLSQVFAWQIDFHRIQRGDEFKVIYEEELIDGVRVGVGDIKAAYFKNGGREFYAFYFEQDGQGEYFDEEGNSLRKAFLQAPLEYSRISSRYSRNRFHPILRTNRPHLGTDYAAPTGTPIRSVGDGVVTEAAYTRGNGRYVKVRHNSVYETQYLHMSRFASGISAGVRVEQGQIIGYVGQTGLATGPHLCFRFWKNGRQVDHFNLDLPDGDPVQEDYREEYEVTQRRLMDELNRVPQHRGSEQRASTV